MSDKNQFMLHPDEVPDPTRSNQWADILRWMICVMDPDDSSLPFVAGSLSYCLKNNGLTHRQAKIASKLFDRVCDDWSYGILMCQLSNKEEKTLPKLENLKPVGEA